MLRLLAENLRQVIRDADILARTGGDEFAILLPETPLAEAIQLAEQLSQTVSKMETSAIQDRKRVTLSLGLADIEERCSGFEELFQRAEKALLISNKADINHITLWDVSMGEKGEQSE